MSDTQSTKNSFVAQLQADAEKYKDSTAQEEYCAQVREQAAEHFLESLLSGKTASSEFEQNTLHRNKTGQQTVRLSQWQGRGPTYLDQSLSDLLDLGDLLQRMQDYLDSTYGAGEFRVFNHRVRGNRNRTVSLTVSWNKEGFENVDSIIKNNRERALERQQRHADGLNRGSDDEEEDQQSRPPRRRDDRPPRRDDRRYDDRAPRRDDRRYDDRPARRDDRAPRRDDRRYDDRAPRRDDRRDDRRRPAERSMTSERPSRRRAAMSSPQEE